MFFNSDRPYNALHECQKCGLLVALQHSYINKHGDIEQLCGYCYTEAIEGESPELARRDRKVAAWLAVVGVAALALWLTGCAGLPHTVETRIVDGKKIEIHTDAPKELERTAKTCVEPWDGCADLATNRVFMRSPVAADDVEHELDHHAGMVHGLWVNYGNYGDCAYVFVGGKKYQADTMICRIGKRMTTYSGLAFFKMAGVL